MTRPPAFAGGLSLSIDLSASGDAVPGFGGGGGVCGPGLRPQRRPISALYESASSRAMAGRNCMENMTAVVVTARASATGSAKNTAKTLSAKNWGRI